MSLAKILIEDVNINTDKVNQRLKQEYSNAVNPLGRGKRRLGGLFYNLYTNEKGNLSKYHSKTLNICKDLFPYSGEVFRVISMDIKQLLSYDYLINDVDALNTIKQYFKSSESKPSPEVFEGFEKAIYDFFNSDSYLHHVDKEFVSWTKSQQGAGYFKDNQFGNHNILLKSKITDGMNMSELAEYLRQEVTDTDKNKIEGTKMVEEIIGYPDSSQEIEVIFAHPIKKLKKQKEPTGYDLI